MYRVIKYFTDLQDNNYPYEVGSAYPREGLSVSRKRLEELSSSNNKQGIALIVKVDDTDIVEEIEKVKKPKVEIKKANNEKPKKSTRGRGKKKKED